MISLIAAIGQNRELGQNGQLLFHIADDMKFFKETTMGHPILMGRKTFDSIGRPLPGRTNYVITHHPEKLPDGVHPVTDLEQFLKMYTNSEEELFVIGGGTVYSIALNYAHNLYLTEVDASASDADTFFPDFNKAHYSRNVIKKGKDHDLTYSIVKYTKH